MLHGAIFLATCNAILLLRDVKLPNASLHHTPLMFSGRDYFAGLKVTKRNKATVLLTLTLLQTPTLTLTTNLTKQFNFCIGRKSCYLAFL
jgi:hypothetical protein